MWKQGITKGYKWEAKVFDNPSIYGIPRPNGRRISKLLVFNYSGVVYEYDRGQIINKLLLDELDEILTDCLK